MADEDLAVQTCKLVSKLTTETFTCANCAQEVVPDEMGVTGLMSLDKEKIIGQEAWTVVPLLEVISKVFNLKMTSESESEDVELSLCSTCGKYLMELYKFYELFVDLGALDSKIADLRKSTEIEAEVEESEPEEEEWAPKHRTTRAKRTTAAKASKSKKSKPRPRDRGRSTRIKSNKSSKTKGKSKKLKSDEEDVDESITPPVKIKTEVEDVEMDPLLICESSLPSTPDHFSPQSDVDEFEVPPTDMKPKDDEKVKVRAKRKKRDPNDPAPVRAKRKRGPRPRAPPTPQQCTLCEKILTSKTYLKVHMMAVHQQLRPFKCKYCEKCFKTKGPLDYHLKNHEGPPEKIALCSICGTTFRNKGSMQAHYKMHFTALRKPTFKCDLCEKSMCSPQVLKRHMLVTHSDLVPRTFTCEICGNAYKTGTELRRHLPYHLPEEERPHKCPYCGRGFPRKASLKDHLISGAHMLTEEKAKEVAGIVSRRVVIVDND